MRGRKLVVALVIWFTKFGCIGALVHDEFDIIKMKSWWNIAALGVLVHEIWVKNGCTGVLVHDESMKSECISVLVHDESMKSGCIGIMVHDESINDEI